MPRGFTKIRHYPDSESGLGNHRRRQRVPLVRAGHGLLKRRGVTLLIYQGGQVAESATIISFKMEREGDRDSRAPEEDQPQGMGSGELGQSLTRLGGSAKSG